MEDKYALGNKIRKVREKKHLTQMGFAELIAKSTNEISNIENGKVRPNTSTLKAISNVFGVSIDSLLSNDTLSEIQEYIEEINLHMKKMSKSKLVLIFKYVQLLKEMNEIAFLD